MRIDLHTHSNVSDGSQPPADVVASAAQAGLDVVGLCDHDTTSGWLEAIIAGEQLGVEVIPGVEISCARGPVGIHMLGYGINPRYAELADELERIRNDRVPRAKAVVRRLNALGVEITWQDVVGQVSNETVVGRPHIADAMVARGVVADRHEAFARYLNRSCPAYVSHRVLDPASAVEMITAADGVAVIAHPKAGRGGAQVSDELIANLCQVGLVGIEVDHPDHPQQIRPALADLADQLQLVKLGSSDYHGTGKTIAIGQETTDPQQYEALRHAMRRARWGWEGARQG